MGHRRTPELLGFESRVGEAGGDGNFGRQRVVELVVELLVDRKRLGVDTRDEWVEPDGKCPEGSGPVGKCPDGKWVPGDVLEGGREGTEGVWPLGGVCGGGEFSLDDAPLRWGFFGGRSGGLHCEVATALPASVSPATG